MNAQTATTSVPTETTDQTRPAGRRRSIIASLIAGLLATVALLVAAPAGAYTVTSGGVPVAPVIYQVQGAHWDAGSAVTGPMWKQWIYQSGPVVNRVTGSGAQYVRVVYSVDRWYGSWVQRAQTTVNVTIGAAQVSAKAAALSILPSDGTGYYRVRLAMTWTSPIGAVIGSLNVTMDGASDYICSTTRPCTAGGGWVYLG
jgi:hypothetical protein